MKHAVAVDAGIVDHDVQGAIGIHSELHQSYDFLLLGHIDREGAGSAAGGLNFSHGLVGRQNIGDYHLGAFLRELFGDALAQTTAGTGDDCYFVLKTHNNNLLIECGRLLNANYANEIFAVTQICVT